MNRVDDPYMRAVLSRVGGDDWDSVLQEEAIPLLDRVAIAVSNLKDDEVSNNGLCRQSVDLGFIAWSFFEESSYSFYTQPISISFLPWSYGFHFTCNPVIPKMARTYW